MKNTRSPKQPSHPKSGTILFVVMSIIIALGAIALTTYSMMLNEIKMGGNQIHTSQALYEADAGLKYVKRQLENRLELDSEQPLELVVHNLQINPPEGYNFDPVTDFEIIVPERLVRFSVTGRSGKAKTTIEASLRRAPGAAAGIFGSDQVYMFPGADAYAYDSRLDYDPAQSNVPGEASVGSNGFIDLKTSTVLDGSIILGKGESDQDASCNNCTDYEQIELEDPFDNDPLGMFGGALETTMNGLSTQNDNGDSDLIHNGRLRLTSHQSGTLSTGSYFLSDLELKSGSLLNIDSSAGPVKLYVTDWVRIWPGSEINHTGAAMNLQIFSSTHRDVKILPSSDFTGMIYAPNADVLAMPNGNYNGTIWSKNAYIKPGGRVNIDIAVLDQILTNSLKINHWKEFRKE